MKALIFILRRHFNLTSNNPKETNNGGYKSTWATETEMLKIKNFTLSPKCDN